MYLGVTTTMAIAEPAELAYERAFESHWTDVFRFALAWTNEWTAAEDLARASGSDSVPNMIDVAKQYAGVGMSAIPVLGPMAYRAKAALAPILDARAARQQRARGMQMQYPDPNKYQFQNQFGPPVP